MTQYGHLWSYDVYVASMAKFTLVLPVMVNYNKLRQAW